MFGNLGSGELMLIFLVVLIFFGAKKIPDIAKGLGQGVREFRKALREVDESIQKDDRQLKSEQKEEKNT